MHNVYILALNDSSAVAKIQQALPEDYSPNTVESWEKIPGENDDPKLLLRLTSPVIVYINEAALEDLPDKLQLLNAGIWGVDRRHPVLFIIEEHMQSTIYDHMLALDGYLLVSQLDLIGQKLKHLIQRSETMRKISRDLNEASEIALLSMSHSSELGEISRFILTSYECQDYDSLLKALFDILNNFHLEASALVVVDDMLEVQTSSGIIEPDLKSKLMKYHGVKRISDLGAEMVISHQHGSIFIHNMPVSDPARHGRLTDNLALLCQCFEARIRGIDAEIKAAEASRAKTMFLATMSHELRTPLNSVIGYSNRLIKKLAGRLSEKEERQLDAVKRNGDHLLRLITDILDFSKIEVGQMEIFPEDQEIINHVRNVYDQLLPIAQNKSLGMKFRTDVEQLNMMIDPKRFTQILMNLMSNAIKYTVEGHVEVYVYSKQHETVGDSIVIAISDTGIGISDEDKVKLFGSFSQIDSALTRTVEGSGLGLAISLYFAKSHGGCIEVDSTPGEGSCFSLVLPTSPPNEKNGAES